MWTKRKLIVTTTKTGNSAMRPLVEVPALVPVFTRSRTATLPAGEDEVRCRRRRNSAAAY